MNQDTMPIAPDPRLNIRELEIPIRDETSITARCYRKADAQDRLPVLVYMHGGGYVMGGLETDDKSCRTVALSLPILILSKGFILGGTSEGANFTTGVSHLLREEELRYRFTGLVFLAGSFCHPDVRPEQCRDRILSVDEVDNAPGLTRKSIDYFAGRSLNLSEASAHKLTTQYGALPFDKRLSPLLFDSHAELVNKAYFAICG